MSVKPDNPQAFPLAYNEDEWSEGMTLLDYFAAKVVPMMYKQIAEQGINEKRSADLSRDSEFIAIYSYTIAEAMLKERANH